MIDKEILSELKKQTTKIEDIVKILKNQQEWIETQTRDQRVVGKLIKDLLDEIREERKRGFDTIVNEHRN